MTRYKEFEIGYLFNRETTATYKGYNSDDLISENGKIPVVVNSARNNGISGFTSLPALNEGNVITLSDTVNSDDTIFYQENDFIGFSHVNKLVPKFDKFNKYSAVYIISAFKKSIKGDFDYNRKFTEYIESTEIKLPVRDDEDTEPDWEVMEQTVKNLASKYLDKIRQKGQTDIDKIRDKQQGIAKMLGINDFELTDEENLFVQFQNVNWKEFELEEILDWQNNINELNPLDLDGLSISNKAKYPFYGQSTVNNGVIGYWELIDGVLNNRKGKPTILIHSNNSNVVYLDTPFYLKDGHGATSVLQSQYLTKEVAFFLMSCIRRAVQLFSYNSKATKIALKHTKIKLPVKSDKKPDYDYMSKISQIMIKKSIQKYERDIARHERDIARHERDIARLLDEFLNINSNTSLNDLKQEVNEL